MSLFNRAEVIDKNFTLKVENEDFPLSISPSLVKRENIKKSDLISIFESIQRLISLSKFSKVPSFLEKSALGFFASRATN